MLIIWLGAGLFFAGVLYMAAQTLWRGPLSTARRARRGTPTLEPPTPPGDGLFGLPTNWPGVGMMVIGGILLLAGAGNLP